MRRWSRPGNRGGAPARRTAPARPGALGVAHVLEAGERALVAVVASPAQRGGGAPAGPARPGAAEISGTDPASAEDSPKRRGREQAVRL